MAMSPEERRQQEELNGQARLGRLGAYSTGASDFDVANSLGRTQEYERRKRSYENRGAPTTNFADALAARGQGQQARGEQAAALGLTAAAARGEAPSAARAQFIDALGASQAQQASIAASARGGGLARAAAQRTAANNAAAVTQNAAAQSASLRAQEMAQARGEYNAAASGLRASDLSQQGQDASQAQFLTQAELQSRAQNDAMVNAYENQQTSLATQGFQGQLARQGAIDNAYAMGMQKYGIDKGVAVENNKRTDSYIAAGAATVGTGLALMSDERAKTDVRSGDAKAQSFLDALDAADYRYKNPGAPGQSAGRHTSVMAQDLEKSELGKRMVRDTPSGKMVDYGEGFASMLAGVAKLNKDVSSLKSALDARKARG